jgi:hypothetical protein
LSPDSLGNVLPDGHEVSDTALGVEHRGDRPLIVVQRLILPPVDEDLVGS